MKERVELCVQLAPMLLLHCEQFADLVQSTVEAYQAAHPVVMSLFDDIYEKDLHEKFPMFHDAAEQFESVGAALGIFEDEGEDGDDDGEDGADTNGGRGEVDDDEGSDEM